MNIVQLNTTKANNLEQVGGCSAILIKASELNPKQTNWVWKNTIASGKLGILAGVAGNGKTTISILIGSIITIGGKFPDGTSAPIGQVVMWTGEDDMCDTLTPRLMAMGADLTKFNFVQGTMTGSEERSFDPSIDMQLLINEITKLDSVKLLIIDPIVAVVKGDSHKNAEVRKDLTPLVKFAESSGIAILGITHFSKGTTGREPIERLTGSLAFGAVARTVLVASKSKNEDGEDTRIFIRAKSNIGVDEGGFEYSIEPVNINGIDTSKIVWGRTLEGSARELLGNAEEESSSGGLEGCMSLITDLMADKNVSANEIEKDCKDNGYSVATIRRAKKKLGIKSRKSDKKEGLKGVWLWEPPKMLNMLNDAHSQNVNPLYKNERLDEEYTN